MNLHLAFQTFLSYLDFEREKVATRKLEQVAKSENLDDFLTGESSEPGIIEYSTTHGFRFLCPERPELNEFVVAKKGIRFSKARNLPYIYLQTKCEPPQLIVECHCVQASNAGYATAVRLPIAKPCVRACAIAGRIDEYPEGTMVVRITEDNKESADSGYTNAVPLPYSPGSVYIQKIDMLDTEYAAMLVDFRKFSNLKNILNS